MIGGDGDALEAVLAARAEKIVPEMTHPVGQKVLEFHLGNVFQQVFFEQRLPFLEIPALKFLGIDKVGQHRSKEIGYLPLAAASYISLLLLIVNHLFFKSTLKASVTGFTQISPFFPPKLPHRPPHPKAYFPLI